MKARRIGIIGPRIHGRPDVVRALVRSFAAVVPPVEIVTMDAGLGGVGQWVAEEAEAVGLPVRLHPSTKTAVVADRVAGDDLAELHVLPWRGGPDWQPVMSLLSRRDVYVEIHRPMPWVEVWTTRLGSRDPDELDITRMTACAKVEANPGEAVFVRPGELYGKAFAAERAGKTLLDIQRTTVLSLGHPWAPSKELLHEALRCRALAKEAREAGEPDKAERIESDAWHRYVNGDPGYSLRLRGFTAEMRESAKHNALAWGWALARSLRGTPEAPLPGRLVLACVCPSPERCHRSLVAGMFGALGATVRGEIPSNQLSLLPTDPTPETDT